MELTRVDKLCVEDNTSAKPDDFYKIEVYANTHVLWKRFGLWSTFIHVTTLNITVKVNMRAIGKESWM